MELASSIAEIVRAFLEFFSDTLLKLIADWWALPAEKRIGSLLGFVVALGTGLHSLQWLGQRIFRTRARLEEQIEGLKAEVESHEGRIESLDAQLSERDKTIDEMSNWLPEKARKAAERERRDGNDESEARVLSEFVTRLTPDLAAFSRNLAQFYAARSFEDPKHHLDEARRFVHLADMMEPKAEETNELAHEIERLHSEFQVARLEEQDERKPADAIARALGIETMWAPETRIDYLRDLAFLLHRKGLQQAAYLFMDRAARYAATRMQQSNGLRATTECWAGVFEADIGRLQAGWARFEKSWPFVKESLGERSNPGLLLKLHRAQLLYELEQHIRALAEINSLLPIQEELHSPRHADVIQTRWLRAKVLNSTGQPEEALREVEGLLPIHNEIFGERHHNTLAVRWLRAVILRDLDRHAEALAEVEAILPLECEAAGEHAPNTLALRWLRASILEGMDRNEEAVADVEQLLSIEFSVLGSKHPHTLAAQELHATLLESLGRSREALDEIDAVLPIRNKFFGERHPDTLIARYHRASVLSSLDRNDEALSELDTVLPLQREVEGDQNLRTLASESLRLGILVATGRARDVLTDLQRCLENLLGLAGEKDRVVLRTRYRLGRARFALGHKRLARAECDSVVAALTATESSRRLLVSTRALSAQIEGEEINTKLIT